MRWAEPVQVRIERDLSFPSSTTARARAAGGMTIWTVGPRVADWIEKNCVLTTAAFANRPFKLLHWQKRFLAELFEVVETADGWRLKHRWCLLGLPKKNGKSELIAALGLFFLLGTDEVDPRVFVAASTEDQANMVFGPTKFMARNSQRLSPMVTVKTRLIESNGSRGGYIRRIAASGGANDGANVYVALIDEFHEWTGEKGRDTWNILTNGTVMRDEPMVIQITTAGYDEDTLCYEWYQSGKALLDGDQEDDTFYFCWFEADEDADWQDLDVVESCNPSFGVIMGRDFYADQIKRKTEAVYRRYYLNQWTDAEEIWEAAQKWDELVGKPIIDTGTRTYFGIDIGRKIDNSACVGVQIHEGDDGVKRAHVFQKIWANPYGKGDSRRARWRMNIFDVDKYVRDMRHEFPKASGFDPDEEDYRLPGPVFAYDPHLYGSHADKLSDDDINMQEFPQTDTQMVPASQLLFEWIMDKRIVHDGDPVARRHIRSVVAKEKERGWRISKPVGTTKHVDFAVALAMALRVAVANENVDESDSLQIW